MVSSISRSPRRTSCATGSSTRSANRSTSDSVALAGPAQQRPQPRLELLERERLDQVVVGADVEPLDAIVDRVAGGEHQDRRAVAGLAHPARDLEPVDARHRDVEHDGVGRVRGERVERLLAVGRERDLVLVEPQRALERPPHGRLVIDHQNARHLGANDGACA